MRIVGVTAALVVLMGCLIPRPFVTRTEIVEPADSSPVFGEKPSLRVLGEERSVSWDTGSRSYLPTANDFEISLRVARLRDDIYLVQVAVSGVEYYLVPVRVSPSGEAVPLACEGVEEAASTHGVSIRPADDYKLELRGDRPGVIGFLLAVSEGCSSMLKLKGFTPPRGELADAAAEAGHRPTRCVPCPAGQGACVEGSVTDPSGAVLPGATVEMTPSGGGEPRRTLTDRNGGFFLKGLPDGTYTLSRHRSSSWLRVVRMT
jgi:hypothetical protein